MTIINRREHLKEELNNTSDLLSSLGYFKTDDDKGSFKCIMFNQQNPGAFEDIPDEVLGFIINENVPLAMYNDCMDFYERINYVKDNLSLISNKSVELYTNVEANPHYEDPDGFNAKHGHKVVRCKVGMVRGEPSI